MPDFHEKVNSRPFGPRTLKKTTSRSDVVPLEVLKMTDEGEAGEADGCVENVWCDGFKERVACKDKGKGKTLRPCFKLCAHVLSAPQALELVVTLNHLFKGRINVNKMSMAATAMRILSATRSPQAKNRTPRMKILSAVASKVAPFWLTCLRSRANGPSKRSNTLERIRAVTAMSGLSRQ